MSACRSCGAEIIWAVTDPGGRRIPLDAEPAERPTGLFTLVMPDPVFTADTTPIAVSAAKTPVYISHFVTCPHADQHRKKAS